MYCVCNITNQSAYYAKTVEILWKWTVDYSLVTRMRQVQVAGLIIAFHQTGASYVTEIRNNSWSRCGWNHGAVTSAAGCVSQRITLSTGTPLKVYRFDTQYEASLTKSGGPSCLSMTATLDLTKRNHSIALAVAPTHFIICRVASRLSPLALYTPCSMEINKWVIVMN